MRTDRRDDRLSRPKFEAIKDKFDTWASNPKTARQNGVKITHVAKDCSKFGISLGSLASPSNIFWKLHSFDSTRQLAVDEFHNLPEGHAHLFYSYFFDSLTEDAKGTVQSFWNDSESWDPRAG